jgi:acetyl-CoA carboxylase carboxyltransferase component
MPPPAPSLPPRIEDPGAVVPAEPRQVYDVRRALEGILDAGSLLELSPRWAKNMVCGLARLEGRAVGVVANQPKFLGGVIDAAGSEKAARFVATCDRFGLPLLVFADTPGFMPGGRQEAAGVIRYGADLLRAFAAARVPKLTVVLRKAYGGAYITMNSKGLGADLVFAWPQAELGIMGAKQAVGVIHRRESDERRAELADEYAEEHLGAATAARDGFVDEIVEPVDTRPRLAWSLEALCGR